MNYFGNVDALPCLALKVTRVCVDAAQKLSDTVVDRSFYFKFCRNL